MRNSSNSKIYYIINEYVHNGRDRYILQSRWIEGKTYRLIAEEIEMSDRGVQYIVDRYTKLLHKYFV